MSNVGHLIFDLVSSEILNTERHATGKIFLQVIPYRIFTTFITTSPVFFANFSLLPYENISKILSLNKIGTKIISAGLRKSSATMKNINWRYLFSLLLFSKGILDYFGYQTTILMADMKAGRNTHCALLLEFKTANIYLIPAIYSTSLYIKLGRHF
jgi:hypothetical protein